MAFFIIANNQVFGAEETLVSACVVVYREIVRREGASDIVFEILEQDDSDQVWFHFNASYECVHTASDRVVWSP
jgi:hypothetical protein